MTTDAFAREVARTALRKMFRPDSHFDICAVKECLGILKIVAPKEEIELLHPLHCISWSQMEPEMRAEVVHRVAALFDHPQFAPEILADRLLQPNNNRSAIRRLLS